MAGSQETIVVLGAGGVGGVLAAGFSAQGKDVELVRRRSSLSKTGKGRIHLAHRLETGVTDLGWQNVRETVEVHPETECLILAVKAYHLADPELVRMLSSLKPDTRVLPLLNGCEHIESLRKLTRAKVFAGSFSGEGVRIDSDHFEVRSRTITLEYAHDLEPEELPLGGTGAPWLRVVKGASEAEVLWKKLARLAVISTLSAATELPWGEILSDSELKSRLLQALAETRELARGLGVFIDAEAQVQYVLQMDPQFRSSMARDFMAGRPHEADSIYGAVRRAARKQGLATPAFDAIGEMLQKRYPNA